MYLTKQEIETIKSKLDLFVEKTITIICSSEWGMGASHICGKLIKTEIKKYARYDNAIFVYVKPKRKHKIYGYVFYGEKEFKFFAGEKEKIDPFKPVSSNSEITISESKYLSFDSRYITDYGTENLICERLRNEDN